MYRPPELEQHKNIWLTKNSYEWLREEKKKLKEIGVEKSMAKILDEIISNYGLQRNNNEVKEVGRQDYNKEIKK